VLPQRFPSLSPAERIVVDFPLIPAGRMAAFGDRIVVRDPRGRSARPSLVSTSAGLEIRGPFQIRRSLIPTRDRGVKFVDATGDANPIHRIGEVVPGAFVASQFVSAAEILLPGLHLDRLRATFSGVCWYDRALRVTVKATPVEGGLTFEAAAYQDEREVARATLSGHLREHDSRVELPLSKVDGAWLMKVVGFYEALGIDPEIYFHGNGGPDLSYPIAFLASLPSGSMVERFKGAGGILNRLTLEFGENKLAIAGPPEVSLELPKRLRRSFNKILTRVKDGVETAVRGTALVLPRPEQDFLTRTS
jgi:hypothetical protein